MLTQLPLLFAFQILKLLSGKIVIGHAIHNDFKALKYFHPKSLTRDTSKIPLLNRKAGFPENESASLKRLTKQLLHRDIQVTMQVSGCTCTGVEPGCSLVGSCKMKWDRCSLKLRSCSRIHPVGRKGERMGPLWPGSKFWGRAACESCPEASFPSPVQVGHNGHSSVEDARATMELYRVIEVEWERHLATSPPQDGPPGTT